MAPAFIPDPTSWSPDDLTAAWLGQSTVLMNFYGTWVLTDPVFSEQVGLDLLGLITVGPKRMVRPALMGARIPGPDIILISHSHMDHCDIPSLASLGKGGTIVMPMNTSDLVENVGFQKVHELDWMKTVEAAGVRITAVEVTHNGWRLPWERSRSSGHATGRSCNAYVLEKKGRKVFFVGDSGYRKDFSEVRTRHGDMDLAIAPIGGYDPHIDQHMTPEQAVEVGLSVGARAIFPIHWKTFLTGKDSMTEPMERFKAAMAGKPAVQAIDEVGATWRLDRGPEGDQEEG